MKRVVTLIALVVSMSPLVLNAQTVVQMTDTGFVPNTISIATGDTVSFENIGSEDHWPASNPHPVHTLYPEFDPRHPVVPGQSWSFAFTRPGTWHFHDHLSPNYMGTIIVGGSTTTIAEEPLAAGPSLWSRFSSAIVSWWHAMFAKSSSPQSTAFAYVDPTAAQVDALYQKWKLPCTSTDFSCAAGALTQITSLYGPRVASAFLKRSQQEGKVAPSVDDHQLMHRIGRETANVFGETGDAFRMCPMSDFNGGCQHGFFEQVLGHASSTTGAAEKICGPMKATASSKVYFDCYHGVGHGVMMAQAYDLSASLAVCDSLSDPIGQDGCWQGVFMENVNAAILGTARPGIFSDTDPFKPCDVVDKKYQPECYINQFGWLMRVSNNSVSTASTACLNAPSEERNACLQSIGLAVTNPAWQMTMSSEDTGFTAKAVGLCLEFPAGHIDQCIIGAIDNLMNFDQLDTSRSAAFCAALAPSLQEVCYRQIGVNIKRQSTASTDTVAICAALPGKNACLQGVSL